MRFSKRASRFLDKLWWTGDASERLDRMEASLGRIERTFAEYSAQCSREAAVADRDQILNRVDYVNHNLYLHLKEAMRLRELYFRDLLLILDRTGQFLPGEMAHLETEHPVALGPDDHPATGASYHRTVKPQEWWEKAFAMRDLPMRRSH